MRINTQDSIHAKQQTQQPTLFTLNTYTLAQVFDTPHLITSLADYSESRRAITNPPRLHYSRPTHPETSSIVFLQLSAAAEYFTTNKLLMKDVPPVNVDISMCTLPLVSVRAN